MVGVFSKLDLTRAVAIQRAAVAVFFMAHAIVRVTHWTIPQFAEFMAAKGWPWPMALVVAVTAAEICCGYLLIVNAYTFWATLPLAAIATVGIAVIHWPLGWFVGEHGTGGMEYSFSLLVSLLVVAVADLDAKRASQALGQGRATSTPSDLG